jgi:proteasome accessory factor B
MVKLTRITDKPRRLSKVGAYGVPEDLDLRALARSLDPREPHRTATIAVRAGKGPTLRRQSRPADGSGTVGTDVEETEATATAEVAGVRLPVGFEVLRVAYSDRHSLAEEVVRYGADAIVLDPPEVRERVLDMLARVAAGSVPASGGSADRLDLGVGPADGELEDQWVSA